MEIASGTGEHAVYFARRFPKIEWQPSDPDETALASISAWIAESELPNIARPLSLDAAKHVWPIDTADTVFCCNMTHISPWTATVGLFRGSARILAPGRPLIVYGPFLEQGVETASSNLAFDRSLKERDPDWGLRSLEQIDQLAEEHGFGRTSRTVMPANNLTVTYRKN